MIQFECENALKPKAEVKTTLQTETDVEGPIKPGRPRVETLEKVKCPFPMRAAELIRTTEVMEEMYLLFMYLTLMILG